MEAGFGKRTAATFAVAGAHKMQMRSSGDFSCLNELRTLCLHFAECQVTFFAVESSDGVGNDRNSFTLLEKSEGGCLDGAFCGSADENEFTCFCIGQESFYSRLFEGVNASFMEYNLPVISENIGR